MRPFEDRTWADQTTEDIRTLIERDPVVVLPLAAIEQHGPHLPLSTDLEIGVGILAKAVSELPEDFPASVLPPVVTGASEEHIRFPGTISLSSPQLTELIVSIGRNLAAHGVRRFVLSNSHGGNRAALDVAGLRLRQEESMLVVKASYFRFPRPTETNLPEEEWVHGLHGGAVETSMMLHLRPDLVKPVDSKSFRSLGQDLESDLVHLRPEGPASFSWLASDLNPSGVVGAAEAGTAQLGSRLVDHYGRILADVIADARRFPLDRLA